MVFPKKNNITQKIAVASPKGEQYVVLSNSEIPQSVTIGTRPIAEVAQSGYGESLLSSWAKALASSNPALRVHGCSRV